MIQCAGCRTQNWDVAIFCASCGKRLDPAAASAEARRGAAADPSGDAAEEREYRRLGGRAGGRPAWLVAVVSVLLPMIGLLLVLTNGARHKAIRGILAIALLFWTVIWLGVAFAIYQTATGTTVAPSPTAAIPVATATASAAHFQAQVASPATVGQVRAAIATAFIQRRIAVANRTRASN